MPSYRDVDPDLRINTLEARVAERDAALAARDAELNEFRALDRSVRTHRVFRVVAMAGVLTTVALGLALGATRSARTQDAAFLHDSIEMARARQRHAEEKITDSKLALTVCTSDLAKLRDTLPSVVLYGKYDYGGLEKALDAAAAEAARCAPLVPEKGTASVQMVFDPMEGKIVSATLDPGPFSGTPAEACLLAPFRGARTGAFKGIRAAVTRELTLR